MQAALVELAERSSGCAPQAVGVRERLSYLQQVDLQAPAATGLYLVAIAEEIAESLAPSTLLSQTSLCVESVLSHLLAGRDSDYS